MRALFSPSIAHSVETEGALYYHHPLTLSEGSCSDEEWQFGFVLGVLFLGIALGDIWCIFGDENQSLSISVGN